MQDIEPHFKWRDEYTAEDDKLSPFYRRTYSEFEFTNKVYNYYIHPQWDEFDSETLYTKILFVDYDEKYAIMEFIGEWNDCLHNDIMLLKDNVINPMLKSGITKFILFCDNVLNFHSSDDAYYEAWYEDIKDEGGWITMINTFDHVGQDLKRARIQNYVNYGADFNDINWRNKRPDFVYDEINQLLSSSVKGLW